MIRIYNYMCIVIFDGHRSSWVYTCTYMYIYRPAGLVATVTNDCDFAKHDDFGSSRPVCGIIGVAVVLIAVVPAIVAVVPVVRIIVVAIIPVVMMVGPLVPVVLQVVDVRSKLGVLLLLRVQLVVHLVQ